jgi:predicted nucleic acid-binding Zn ribbon protein
MGHESHRRKRSLRKTAARIVLVLGILAFAGAVAHFTYLAYESGDCFTANTDADTGMPDRRVPVDSEECRLILSHNEDHQRVDAAIAMLAIVILIGSVVRLSNASRRTRRIVFMVEVALIAVGAVYAILLATFLR